jgi:hypothetical protein
VGSAWEKVPHHPDTVRGGIGTVCHPSPCNHSPLLSVFPIVTRDKVQYLMCVEEYAGVASASPATPYIVRGGKGLALRG